MASGGTGPPGGDRSARYERGGTEFDRAFAFFDATYAVALTLLVTTLDRAAVGEAWESLDALASAIGVELLAFFLSFAVVATYWRANHRFVAGLQRLSGPLIAANLVMLAFVVLLPFSTDALGEFPVPLSTAVYAVNVAVISSTEALMSVLAWRQGLLAHPTTRRAVTAYLVPQLVPPAVFLVSVPLAYLLSAEIARLSWLSLVVLGPLAGGWARRAARG